MTTPLDLAAIRALVEGISDGPWRHDFNAVRSPDGHALALTHPLNDGGDARCQTHRRDAEFIAAARTAVPALLNAIGRVLDLHVDGPSGLRDDPRGGWCQADGEIWPCPTVAALGVEADPNG